MYEFENNDKWNDFWIKNKTFAFDRKNKTKPMFVIDTPPPNTSGGLHMGHVYWVCYVDFLARYKHMKGFNVFYPQGWDTQGFPTEIQVEKRYGKDLPRAEFYEKCKEFATEDIKILKDGMRRLGASFDESLEYITMSDSYRAKIQLSLILMYEKSLVYRAKHPVEWCPHCKSSVAREELDDIELKTTLNTVEFDIVNGNKSIEIATTRPELMHACVAIAVNPEDKRYKEFIGKSAIVPIFNSIVPIIEDEQIDMEFGTGAEMICTFGDKTDVIMYYKHKLDIKEALDEDGRLINAGEYTGLDTTTAKEKILSKLAEMKKLKSSKSMTHTVRVHHHCGTPIELLSEYQWFIKTKENVEKIREVAESINWIPRNEIQRLYDWINYIDWDWNISRKRVFGTPIPFWYCQDCGNIIPAKKEDLPLDPTSREPPVKKCPKCGSENIIGESDTCDVWVDSSITPLIISGWPDDKKLMARAFPADIRMQGKDIIRTWAFYTIFRTSILGENKPFENLLINGMILGPDGREMHKSLGNAISIESLLDKYPIDAIRLWVALSGTVNMDKVFSYKDIDFATKFLIKLWNSVNIVKMAQKDIKIKEPPHESFGVFDIWIMNRLNSIIKEVNKGYESFAVNEAMLKAVNFYWHEFCDYYLEEIKYRINSDNEKSKEAAAFTSKHVLLSLLKLFAPVIPYISEEIYAMFNEDKKSIFEQPLPEYVEELPGISYAINGVVFKSSLVDVPYEDIGALLNKVIAEVRQAKARNRKSLNLKIKAININIPSEYYISAKYAAPELEKICNAEEVNIEAGEFKVEVVF
ncbi:MAG: valine--tRNA ligase [Candidatus Micrarchaeia archaeon]